MQKQTVYIMQINSPFEMARAFYICMRSLRWVGLVGFAVTGSPVRPTVFMTQAVIGYSRRSTSTQHQVEGDEWIMKTA